MAMQLANSPTFDNLENRVYDLEAFVSAGIDPPYETWAEVPAPGSAGLRADVLPSDVGVHDQTIAAVTTSVKNSGVFLSINDSGVFKWKRVLDFQSLTLAEAGDFVSSSKAASPAAVAVQVSSALEENGFTRSPYPLYVFGVQAVSVMLDGAGNVIEAKLLDGFEHPRTYAADFGTATIDVLTVGGTIFSQSPRPLYVFGVEASRVTLDGAGNVISALLRDSTIWPNNGGVLSESPHPLYVFGVQAVRVTLDGAGNVIAAILRDGTTWPGGSADMIDRLEVVEAAVTELQAGPDLTKLSYWGDSRYEGAGESHPNIFPVYLAALLAGKGITITGQARGAQTSIMIAARQGGEPLLLSVTGDTIPASGPVAVTAYSANIFLRSSTPFIVESRPGTLAGVPGTYASDGTGAGGLTFTRTTAGSSIAIPKFSPFINDDGRASMNGINVINIGTNGAGTDSITGRVGNYVYDTLRYAQAMVQAVLDAGGIPLISAPIHSNPNTSPDYTNGDLLANLMRGMFGVHFVDYTSPPTTEEIATANAAGLGATFTPDSNDTADMAAGRWPRGLFSDSVHFRRIAQYIQALRLVRFLIKRGIITA